MTEAKSLARLRVRMRVLDLIENNVLEGRENSEEIIVFNSLQNYVRSLKSRLLFDLHMTYVITSSSISLSLCFWNLAVGYLDGHSVQTKFLMRILQ